MGRRIVMGLLLGAVVSPVAISLLVGLAALLAGLGDETGALGTQRVCLAMAVVWALDLIGLLVALGVRAVFEPSPEVWTHDLDWRGDDPRDEQSGETE